MLFKRKCRLICATKYTLLKLCYKAKRFVGNIFKDKLHEISLRQVDSYFIIDPTFKRVKYFKRWIND